MRVLAVDPGGTTGWVIWCDGARIAGQDEFGGFVNLVDNLLMAGDNRDADRLDAIVAEKFTINAQTVRNSQQTTALEVIGYLRAMAHLEGIPFSLQTPADAKRFTQLGTNSHGRLDALGWTLRPLAKHDHANDAQRHLLLYLVKNKLIEVPR